MNRPPPIDLNGIIDGARLGAVQIKVILLCTVIACLEGFDLLAIAFAAPQIASQLHLAPQEIGIIFGAGPVGLALGALLLSPLGDRIGRKPVILICMTILGVSTIALAYANTYQGMVFFRIGLGIGMGGAAPCLETITAEYSPNRFRNLAISIVTNGFALGAILGGVLSGWLIPVFGWPSVFISGGIASLLFLLPVAMFLPESLHFMARHAQHASVRGRLLSVLRRMDPHGAWTETSEIAASHTTESKPTLLAVLAPSFRTSTLFLWLAFFSYFYAMYTLLQWIPSMLTLADFSQQTAIRAGTLASVGAAVGSLVLGAVTGKRNLAVVIMAFFFASGGLMGLFGLAVGGLIPVLWLVFLLGFFLNGAGVGLFMVAARFYPPEMRVTGIGWSSAWGRFGAIAGPTLSGFLLGTGWELGAFFLFLAILPLAAAGAVARVRMTH